MPVRIRVQLQAATAGVVGRDAKVAGAYVGLLGGGVVGAVVAGIQKGDIVAEVQMRVHVHNVQSGADCEDTWTGVNNIRTMVADMDSYQFSSRALAGAVKQAMSNLPGILACVGIEPQ
jgi:hypothetical protein